MESTLKNVYHVCIMDDFKFNNLYHKRYLKYA